ncbi:hypothetical protein F5X99DRAFT_390540 [Biscogniauxia marginata]|nr:hypothetical protein F5X99DRAFT_390540 [Biscogniauxia marginata]
MMRRKEIPERRFFPLLFSLSFFRVSPLVCSCDNMSMRIIIAIASEQPHTLVRYLHIYIGIYNKIGHDIPLPPPLPFSCGFTLSPINNKIYLQTYTYQT